MRLHALASKLGLPALALLAGIGLSAAVGATYVTITHDTNVGTFNPRGIPMEDATPSTTTTTSTTTTLPVSTEVTQVPVSVPGTATTVRNRATTTTTATVAVQAQPVPTTTTTTACTNTGKDNCQSRGKDDPPGGPDD